MSPTNEARLCTSDTLYSDEQVRISRFTLAPGTTTGSHTHEFDYVVAPIRGGTVTIESDGNLSEFELVAKNPYQRSRGVHHSLTNRTRETIDFLEIEYLT
jgi:quercetin dioxygenase-like cupin family protein